MTRIDRHYQRRYRYGSTYVLVLFTSLIVSVVAFAGFQRLRIEERSATLKRDWNDSGVLAASAVEYALAKLGNDRDWREVYQDQKNGNYTAPIALGKGMIRWQLEDPEDGDIADDADDPVRIYGLATVGESSRVFSMLAWPEGVPLDVLRSAVHADGDLVVTGSVDTRKGPATANGDFLVSSGTLMGDVEAFSVDAPEQVVGSVSLLSKAKTMPSNVLFSVYQALGNEIPNHEIRSGNSLTLQGKLISPDAAPSPGSGLNPDGVYWIDMTDHQTLDISNCRIKGTLLVAMADHCDVTIGSGVVWQPARSDYPALLVYTQSDHCPVTIECWGNLSEASAGVNFNPASLPYYGSSDSDTSDNYAASLSGLYHVIRDTAIEPVSETTIRADNKLRGCVLADGNISINTDSILVADPYLYSKPPYGYTSFPDPANLLTNGEMEIGLTAWSAIGPNTGISPVPAFSHGGNACLLVTNREAASSGIQQDVTSRISESNGLPISTEAWIYLTRKDEDVEIAMEVESTGDGIQRFVATATALDKQWSRVQVELIPAWTGTLLSARWQAVSTESKQDFMIDDAILHDPASGPVSTLSAVPGSWRAEAMP